MAFGDTMFDSSAVSPYAGTAAGGAAGGTTFTDMLNGLSGSMPDINNGIQSLAYGIGSFAKDPRKREMYIQAAMAHQQHMSQDKAQHLKALQDHGDKILEFIQKSAGNQQVLNVLKPVIDQHIQALSALGGKDAAAQFTSLAQAAGAMPADRGNLVATPGPDGKPVYGYATAGQPVYEKPTTEGAGSSIGKLAEDLKAGRITQQQFDAMARKETYIAPPSQTNINMPKTIEERDQNILVSGDPGSPEYAMAYSRTFLNPRFVQGTDSSGQQTMVPIMPAVPPNIRKPTYMGQGGGGPAPAADPAAAAAADGAIYKGKDGLPQYEDGTPFDPAKPRKAPAPNVAGSPTAGQPIVTGVGQANKTMTAEATKRRLSLDNLDTSIKQYETQLKKTGTTFAGAAGFPTGDNMKLSSAYTSLLLELKELYNLGVLNGPDYELMQKSIQNPNSVRGYLATTPAMLEQLDLVKSKLAQARKNIETEYGPSRINPGGDAPTGVAKVWVRGADGNLQLQGGQ